PWRTRCCAACWPGASRSPRRAGASTWTNRRSSPRWTGRHVRGESEHSLCRCSRRRNQPATRNASRPPTARAGERRTAMIPTVTLRVVEGPHKGQEFVSTDLTCITIGRSEECTFRLRGELLDLFVSRRHCLIEVRPEWIEVRDLESSNGTYVNGQRIG